MLSVQEERRRQLQEWLEKKKQAKEQEKKTKVGATANFKKPIASGIVQKSAATTVDSTRNSIPTKKPLTTSTRLNQNHKQTIPPKTTIQKSSSSSVVGITGKSKNTKPVNPDILKNNITLDGQPKPKAVKSVDPSQTKKQYEPISSPDAATTCSELEKTPEITHLMEYDEQELEVTPTSNLGMKALNLQTGIKWKSSLGPPIRIPTPQKTVATPSRLGPPLRTPITKKAKEFKTPKASPPKPIEEIDKQEKTQVFYYNDNNHNEEFIVNQVSDMIDSLSLAAQQSPSSKEPPNSSIIVNKTELKNQEKVSDIQYNDDISKLYLEKLLQKKQVLFDVQGSTATILSPVKASKKDRELHGVESVVTPVRRSVRLFTPKKTPGYSENKQQQNEESIKKSVGKEPSTKRIGFGLYDDDVNDVNEKTEYKVNQNDNIDTNDSLEELLECHGYAFVPNKNLPVSSSSGIRKKNGTPFNPRTFSTLLREYDDDDDGGTPDSQADDDYSYYDDGGGGELSSPLDGYDENPINDQQQQQQQDDDDDDDEEEFGDLVDYSQESPF